MSRPSLGLAIPLYNEEALADSVVTAIDDALTAAGIPHVLHLVDNGSTDATPGIVNRLAATRETCRARHLTPNAGYGGGILAGLRGLETDIVGWTWGDGQVGPEVLVACYEAMVAAEAPLAKASRTERQDGLQRRAVTRIYNTLMRLAFDVPLHDVNGCPKLVRREVLAQLDPTSSDWFLDPEVVLKAAELGLRWTEVTAVMQPRAGGASKVRGDTLREFVGNLWAWKRGERR